jgi:hypothetical protein
MTLKCLPLAIVAISYCSAFAVTPPSPSPSKPVVSTTQPAIARWQDAVDHFSEAIVDRDSSSLNTLLVDHPAVHTLDNVAVDAAKLGQTFAGAVVIGTHAYPGVPATLATDIASDFSGAANVPEDVKRKMVPDEATLPRANSTARVWVQSALDSGAGPVGVIVLWRGHSNLDRISALFKDGPGEILFVLIKAQEIDGAPHIRQVVYGEPLAAAN